MKNFLLPFFILLIASTAQAQSFRVQGKITNNKMEPLAFATIQLKEQQIGTASKDDGSYELNLEVGQYNLVVTMIGYKTQIAHVIVNKDIVQNFILEEDSSTLMEDFVIRFKVKDRSEEIMRNVIRNKEHILAQSGDYSANVYIKAIQQDSVLKKRDRAKTDSTIFENPSEAFQGMAMTEVLLHLDYESDQRMKERREGVKKFGKADDLFYVSTTDGNFSFYNNLVKVPSISNIPFLSPVSYSGLLAYKFKTIKTERKDGHRIFTISVKPRQISNATVEGEITILDSTWAILHTRFSFPQYHLPEFDFFEVDQQYEFVQNKAWMITRQQFNYYQKAGAHRLSGQTLVTYSDYELNKNFERNHFGTEV